jgi:hypothetical protein
MTRDGGISYFMYVIPKVHIVAVLNFIPYSIPGEYRAPTHHFIPYSGGAHYVYTMA